MLNQQFCFVWSPVCVCNLCVWVPVATICAVLFAIPGSAAGMRLFPCLCMRPHVCDPCVSTPMVPLCAASRLSWGGGIENIFRKGLVAGISCCPLLWFLFRLCACLFACGRIAL